MQPLKRKIGPRVQMCGGDGSHTAGYRTAARCRGEGNCRLLLRGPTNWAVGRSKRYPEVEARSSIGIAISN
jgi:hypothetical protein